MTSSTSTVTLTAASVNSGVAVNLNCTKCSYGIKNNLRHPPITSSYDISEVEHRGWENPKITVRGVIEDVAPANYVTEQLLKSFGKVKNEDLTLNVVWGSIGNEATFTNVDNSSNANGTTGIPVVVESVNFDLDNMMARNAHVIHYTMVLVEDKV